MDYKNIKVEDIEKAINEYFKKDLKSDDVFVRELTPEEIEGYKKVLGNFAFNGMGDRLFRLPGGAITGIGGVEMFNKAFEEQALKLLNNGK